MRWMMVGGWIQRVKEELLSATHPLLFTVTLSFAIDVSHKVILGQISPSQRLLLLLCA